jgi:hypothetical protein
LKTKEEMTERGEVGVGEDIKRGIRKRRKGRRHYSGMVDKR